MSIKQKLIISNVVMVLIPVICLLLLNALFSREFRERRGGNDDTLDLRPLSDMLDPAGNAQALAEACRAIEDAGGSVSLTGRGGLAGYVSADYGRRAEELAAAIEKQKIASRIVATEAGGSELYMKLAGGGALHIISDKSIPGQLFRRGENEAEMEKRLHNSTIIILLTVLGVILLTNWILTTLLSRSVLIPLKILHDGTNRIKRGDLEHQVVYAHNDEFGDVCADFEDMRVRLWDSVQERQKTEEHKKELIAGISHDLLTPLTHIKGYVAGIVDGVANTPEKRDAYLRTISQTTDTMRKMVDDLFLFSKLDIGGMSLHFELTNLIPYFADCCQDLQIRLDRQAMDVTFTAAVPEAFVLLEKHQFSRVILNIIENSVKYKKEGRGTVVITISKTREHVEIAFTDDGIGVEEEKAPHIFDLFYRTDEARSETRKGSGLGLAVVRQIVELHSGRVAARVGDGAGLTIVVALPNARGGGEDEENTDY